MNINIIKEKLRGLQNERLKFKVYLGRNKYEHFNGYIDKLHSNIFTIKTDNRIKSFAYSDILIKNIVISKLKV